MIKNFKVTVKLPRISEAVGDILSNQAWTDICASFRDIMKVNLGLELVKQDAEKTLYFEAEKLLFQIDDLEQIRDLVTACARKIPDELGGALGEVVKALQPILFIDASAVQEEE